MVFVRIHERLIVVRNYLFKKRGITMGDVTVNVEKLLVWSENPRHSDEISDNTISENEVINILINVVGYSHMFNLAKDILEKGLMGNLRPVVVSKEDKLWVYDGNRRISAIKFLLNPEIINIDNTILKDKITQLLENTQNAEELKDRLRRINVYETSEQDAYDIMDKTHGGVKDGIGTLPWDSYQKDKANNRRGIQAEYPSAFSVVTKLGLKKKDIKDEYTSFDRIFGNTKFKELFQITDYSSIDERYLRRLYFLLQDYKIQVKSNAGFSRIFNKATEESERFYDWANPQINPESSYVINFDNLSIDVFRRQSLSSNLLKYKITNFDNSIVHIEREFLEESYITPNGTTTASFDSDVIGEWKYKIRYYQTEKMLRIVVKDYVNPALMLKTDAVSIPQDQSITSLRDFILISTNSINLDVKNQVSIQSDTATITNDCFCSENRVQTHIVSYKYVDSLTNKEVTSRLKVTVQNIEQEIRPDLDTESKLLTFSKSINLTKYFNKMDSSLKVLISEINSLDIGKYPYVLSAALRSVVHLMDFEYAIKTGNKVGSEMPNKLDNLLQALINDVSTGHIMIGKESWIDESTLKNSFRGLKGNKQWLIDVLNCGAHTAGSSLSEAMVKSAGKEVSSILTYIAILLN